MFYDKYSLTMILVQDNLYVLFKNCFSLIKINGEWKGNRKKTNFLEVEILLAQ